MDELVQPKLHKIIIYDFRKKPPDVEPLKKLSETPRPRGAELSKQAVIATSPNPKSVQQLIWIPTPKIQIQKDVPLPNLIARMKTTLPFVSAIPKEKPQPVVEAAKAVQPNTSPPDPKGDANHAPEASQEAAQPPKVVRTFVPPPPSHQPKLPVPVQVSELPVAPSVGSPAMSNPLPAGAGMPSMLQSSSIPTAAAPVAPVPAAGNARADIAIASLHPSESANTSVPDGGRAGRFSKAPEVGAPASGDVGKSGAVKVPDLTVREDRTKPVKPPPEPPRTKAVLYTERVRSIPASTLSVPLRPSSRTIPRFVDARFQGRNVYTMVVPIENLPAYAGDWIIWFAEKQPVSGSTPLMRAPLPFRRMEPVDPGPAGSPGQARVQIAAILDKDGKLGKLVILTRPATMTEQAVVQDLESWEFKPATRDGAPVDVEVVIEIPFNLAAAMAKQVQP
jgi:Gram-negative bacterial TonB protein C-terminal